MARDYLVRARLCAINKPRQFIRLVSTYNSVPGILYPTPEEVIEANRRVLQQIRVRKADQHGVLMGKVGKNKILKAIDDSESEAGGIYEKAAVLLIGIVRGHAFESGNRRTAYAVAADFLESNGYGVTNTYDVAVIKGIRSGTHKKAEVASWLKGYGEQGEGQD
jgi:death-on-curing family protein